MPDSYYVYGGEHPHPREEAFRDPRKIIFVGSFSHREDARDAWKAYAWQTVDNALMRFHINTYDEMIVAHGKPVADLVVRASGATYS
ncbi:hypothetical protein PAPPERLAPAPP_00070 [Brevundimonas phage vB_BpoS-Papperlapapp]|nr:hypothetical protein PAPPERLAPAPP_00070 [Brevundimonas phage vB_BpoS-Papperlapapp]